MALCCPLPPAPSGYAPDPGRKKTLKKKPPKKEKPNRKNATYKQSQNILRPCQNQSAFLKQLKEHNIY